MRPRNITSLRIVAPLKRRETIECDSPGAITIALVDEFELSFR
jgi:hypothetical protein